MYTYVADANTRCYPQLLSVWVFSPNSKPELSEQLFVKFESATQRLRPGVLTLKDYLELLTHLPLLPQYWAFMFV